MKETSQIETAFLNRCLHKFRAPPNGDGLGETIAKPFVNKVCRDSLLGDTLSPHLHVAILFDGEQFRLHR